MNFGGQFYTTSVCLIKLDGCDHRLRQDALCSSYRQELR
jgi:hypothetical protein